MGKIGGHCQGVKQSFVMYQQEMGASKVEGNQKIALFLTSSIPDRLWLWSFDILKSF